MFKEMTQNYRIADKTIEVVFSEKLSRSPFDEVQGFLPFKADNPALNAETLLSFHTNCSVTVPITAKALYRFDCEGYECVFYSSGGEYCFKMDDGKTEPFRMRLLVGTEHKKSVAHTNWEDNGDYTTLRFGLWMAINAASVFSLAAAIHSSAIVYDDKAYLFLGESGTGKSTHTRLWRENLKGCFLLNDDSPFIAIKHVGDRYIPYVYGSPWSGKTPCYKDLCFPIGGIIRLSQAPYNRARQLGTLSAITAVLPSFPPAFGYDKVLQGRVLDIVSKLLATVKVYHLECLPDKEAVYEIVSALGIAAPETSAPETIK